MPTKFRVAAQMFGFRDYTKTLEDAAKTMKRVKKIGYDYAQISGFGPMDMADLKRVCDDAGVTPIGAHIGLPQFRENEKKVLEDCRKLGIASGGTKHLFGLRTPSGNLLLVTTPL